ncbi:MAG: substrate-binding domain-containing protein [Faecalibacterium sp.]
MAKSVRMSDIAKRLGISTVSVSKGLAGKDGVSEALREKIIATAQEMGYQAPEPLAQTNDDESIGILVPDRFFNAGNFYSSLYRSVLKSATAANLSVMMEIVLPQAEKNCTMPTFLVKRKISGLIFMGEIDRRYVATAAQSGIPFMLLDFYDDALAADCVLSDNSSGAYTLTEHLIATGRRNIGFVGSVCATSSIMDRYLGYVKALLRAGLPIRDDWRLEDRDAQGRLIPLTLPRELPDAFVCNCDEAAYNIVELLKRNGYRVPQDVAVTGYDDYDFSTRSNPQLTTYRVDLDGMAHTVVSQLRRKMAHRAPLVPTAIVPGAFVRREST